MTCFSICNPSLYLLVNFSSTDLWPDFHRTSQRSFSFCWPFLLLVLYMAEFVTTHFNAFLELINPHHHHKCSRNSYISAVVAGTFVGLCWNNALFHKIILYLTINLIVVFFHMSFNHEYQLLYAIKAQWLLFFLLSTAGKYAIRNTEDI